MSRVKGITYIRCTDCRREIMASKATQVEGGYVCGACAREYR